MLRNALTLTGPHPYFRAKSKVSQCPTQCPSRRKTGSRIARAAALMLADGTFFEGAGFGASGQAIGEVCFNTAMTGYQEILTDPSYAGQIVCLHLSPYRNCRHQCRRHRDADAGRCAA